MELGGKQANRYVCGNNKRHDGRENNGGGEGPTGWEAGNVWSLSDPSSSSKADVATAASLRDEEL